MTRASALLAPPAGPGCSMVMQDDGNFVGYTSAGAAYWDTGTYGNPGASVVVQDDGNLVVYAPDGRALWASNTVQDMAALVVRTRDSRGYSYNQTSEALKDFAAALPCFLAMQWPGYASGIVEDRIAGEPVVIQWWKGWCQNFLGFLPASPLPGGVGGEVGIYRRIPGKARPTSLPFLPPLLEADILGRLARVTDNELWWPAPDLGAEIEYRLINPVTGTEFFAGEKQRGYWLAKWMDDSSYAQYRRDVGILNPALPEFMPGNTRTPVDPADYILQFSVNGKVYDSIPAGQPVPRAQGRTQVSAVSRSADKLDIFAAGDGNVRTAAWQPAFSDGWHGWWTIGGARLPRSAPVHAVSRSADKLDIFACDDTGRTLTAAWEPAFTDGWHGWAHICNGMGAPGSPIGGVSRSADKLDIFITGTDGKAYTAAWEPGFTDGWHGWWRIDGIDLPLAAPIQAVSPTPDRLDVFAAAADGRVMTAIWTPAAGRWSAWEPVPDCRTDPGAPVSAVSRSAGAIDIFFTGLDGRACTARFAPSRRGGGRWQAGQTIGDARFPAGAAINAVSRSTGRLDILGCDLTGRVLSAAWEPAFTDGWHGWWAIADGRALPGAPVTAISRAADKLDIFITGTDGRTWSAAWEPGFGGAWHGWWPIG